MQNGTAVDLEGVAVPSWVSNGLLLMPSRSDETCPAMEVRNEFQCYWPIDVIRRAPVVPEQVLQVSFVGQASWSWSHVPCQVSLCDAASLVSTKHSCHCSSHSYLHKLIDIGCCCECYRFILSCAARWSLPESACMCLFNRAMMLPFQKVVDELEKWVWFYGCLGEKQMQKLALQAKVGLYQYPAWGTSFC